MSSSMSSNFRLSCSLKEEVMVTKKQGIMSILGSDGEKSTPASSLRRTLSADMSSKKWQSQHGFSQLKKIASSGQFPVSIIDSSSSSSQLEEEYESQVEKENKEHEKPGQIDNIWASILSQKAQDDSKPLEPPYIHPLVKRSASCLSEKSLEICTESLGSETGSDGFSSYPPSETSDMEEDKEEEEQEEKATSRYDIEDWTVTKHNFTAAASKNYPPKSFPPPLPSLSILDGASLLMRPRRSNGRLVLEAVSVPSQNNFQAQRQDGRLVLTFVNGSKQEEEAEKRRGMNEGVGLFEVEMEHSENEKELVDDGAETEEEEMEMEVKESLDEIGGGGGDSGDIRFVVENGPKVSGGVINFHRLAQVIHKPLWFSYRNQTWRNKLNEIVPSEESVDEVVNDPVFPPVTRSLPPRPPMARMMSMPWAAVAAAATAKPPAKAASSLNAYECYWKPKLISATTAAVSLYPISPKSSSRSSKDNNKKFILSKNTTANDNQELPVLGKNNEGDYFIPLSKGCKESRKSLLYREHHCIATS